MSAFNMDLKDPAIWLLAPLVAPLLPFALLSGCDSDSDTPNIQTISAGSGHTCVLLNSDKIKCWGSNADGQLGNGESSGYETIPVDVLNISSNVQTIAAAGSGHTCALLTSGGVKCWGDNGDGQLGNESTDSSTIPVDVSGLSSGVQTITAGGSNYGSHTCAVVESGGVKCWGNNDNGQLGNGISGYGEHETTPVDVADLSSDVRSIAAGAFHTCAILTSGDMKCWGDNKYGQLGNGETYEDKLTPVDVIGLSSDVQTIAAGVFHTCALLTSGGVMCWGNNEDGQLGNGEISTYESTPVDVIGLSSDVQAIAASVFHTCALLTSGGVMCWGNNEDGQLGNGETSYNESTPVDVFDLSSGVHAIAAGGRHNYTDSGNEYTCASLTAGGMKCWGNNKHGQLGDGTTENSTIPVDVLCNEF